MKALYKASASVLAIAALIGQTGVAETPALDPTPIRVAVAYAPKNLNPATATDAASARLLQLTHPALLKQDEHFQPSSNLATCTQASAHIIMCSGAKNMGNFGLASLPAPEILAWYRSLQDNSLSPFKGALAGVSITAPTPQSLQFETPNPREILQTLTEIPVAIPTSNTLLGLGDYTADTPTPLGEVTLTPKAGRSLPVLTLIPIPDATTRILKLQKGEVDVLANDIPPELMTYARKTGFQTASTPSTSYSYIAYNFENDILRNARVREAMAHSINRPAIRAYLLGGLANPASSLLPPGHPDAYKAPEETFDPLLAEDLLDETPYLRGPDNTRFSLELLTSTDALSQRVAQVIQNQMKSVGIQVNIRPSEWASFYESLQKGNFDMALSSWTGSQPPSFLFKVFNGSQTPPLGLNRGRVNLPELNEATQAIISATTPQNLAEATRKAQKVQAEDRPYLPLYRRSHTLVMGRDITGCTIDADGTLKGLTTCKRR